MIYWLIILMFISHVGATAPAWSALRRGQLPPPVIAGTISFLFYYDFGIAVELLGFDYQVPFFQSILDTTRETQLFVLLILIAAPWVLRVGSALTGPSSNELPSRPWLSGKRSTVFYAIAIAVTALPAWYGLSHLMMGGAIWQFRSQVGLSLGPFIVMLSFPMHILAFYASTEDARTPNGRLFTLFLAFGAICGSIICGQRTLVLFPLLLAALSYFNRVSLLKMTSLAAVCIIAAAAILPLIRGSYSDKTLREDNLLVEIVHNDFSRAGVMATVVELSPPVGTDVLPDPMAGYFYSSLLFVPRDLAPFKGRSTAMHFTGFMVNQKPEWLNWGFGVGMIEELILNTGTRFCLIGVFAYGCVLGLLTRTEMALPAVSIPLRIGPLFLCAYHLPSLLLNFGLMWFVCMVLSWAFITSNETDELPIADHEPNGNLQEPSLC